jgi:hypothetical protein
MSITNSAYERMYLLAYGYVAVEGLDCRMSSLKLLESCLVAATGCGFPEQSSR